MILNLNNDNELFEFGKFDWKEFKDQRGQGNEYSQQEQQASDKEKLGVPLLPRKQYSLFVVTIHTQHSIYILAY